MGTSKEGHDYGVSFGGDAKRRIPARRETLEIIMLRVKGEVGIKGAQARSVEVILEEELHSYYLRHEKQRKRISYLEQKLRDNP